MSKKQSLQPGIEELYNVSYYEREIDQEINASVGKPYGILKSIKMGGIGSPRMTIDDASEGIKPLLEHAKYLKYCNIEIRPKGLIIRFRLRLDALAFVVPFSVLKITAHGEGYRLAGSREYLDLIPFRNRSKVNSFFLKLQRLMNSPNMG